MSFIIGGLAGTVIALVAMHALELEGKKLWYFIIGMIAFAYLIKAV